MLDGVSNAKSQQEHKKNRQWYIGQRGRKGEENPLDRMGMPVVYKIVKNGTERGGQDMKLCKR